MMKFRQFVPITLPFVIGISNVGLAHVQDLLLYPNPEQLSREHHEIQQLKDALKSVRHFAPEMNATVMISPPYIRARLDDAAEILIEIRNTGPTAFYFTVQRDLFEWFDTSPRNFRLTILPKTHCQRTVTIVDTFQRLTEEELLYVKQIVLLKPGQAEILETTLGTWRDVVCSRGQHRLRMEYEGVGIGGQFTHPFLSVVHH